MKEKIKDMIFILILTVSALFFYNKNYAVKKEYKIGETLIGYYNSEKEYNNFINSIRIGKEDGINYYIDIPKATYNTKIINKRLISKKHYNFKEYLSTMIKHYELYEVNIDNKNFYFKNQNDADNFYKKILAINNTKKVEIQKIVTDDKNIITNLDNINFDEFKPPVIIQKKQTTTRSSSNVRTNNNHQILANYNYISSGYRTKKRPNHTGVDFAAKQGTAVYSWDEGTIIFAGYKGNYGNMVIIKHDSIVTRYAHLSKIMCHSNQIVTKKQQIGQVGSTGNSTGPHLHFEILINNNFVNPLKYL